uniref:ANK_REP_REGION domain-containing protein n=1 Tax=Bursaphelenchus xylophilus TaxID=6326 RepID=A0A1I7SGK8_BURXY
MIIISAGVLSRCHQQQWIDQVHFVRRAQKIADRTLASGPPRSSSFHEHLFFHANATQPESIDSPSFKRQSITSRNSDSHLDETDANEIEKKAIKLIETGNIEGILDLMANGFDINARLSTNKYPIHVAINSKQNVLIEFLFLNGIHVNVVDADLNSPLHIAAANGNTLGVYQLVKRNADKDLKNAKGETALQLAVEAQHANIVT